MLGDCRWKQQMFYKKLIYFLFIWKMSHKCLLPSKLTKYNELTDWICSVCFLLVFLFPFLVKFLFLQLLCAFISLRNDPFLGCLVSRCKLACEQALLFGRAKRAARERASERRSREGPARRACSQASCKSSQVPKVNSRSLGSEPPKSQQSRLFAFVISVCKRTLKGWQKDFMAVKKSRKFPGFVNE